MCVLTVIDTHNLLSAQKHSFFIYFYMKFTCSISFDGFLFSIFIQKTWSISSVSVMCASMPFLQKKKKKTEDGTKSLSSLLLLAAMLTFCLFHFIEWVAHQSNSQFTIHWESTLTIRKLCFGKTLVECNAKIDTMFLYSSHTKIDFRRKSLFCCNCLVRYVLLTYVSNTPPGKHKLTQVVVWIDKNYECKTGQTQISGLFHFKFHRCDNPSVLNSKIAIQLYQRILFFSSNPY